MPTMEQRDYFVRRAAEVRDLAVKAKDPDIRQTLESMAASYEALISETDNIGNLRDRLPD